MQLISNGGCDVELTLADLQAYTAHSVSQTVSRPLRKSKRCIDLSYGKSVESLGVAVRSGNPGL